jgi:hypothetical protein
MRLVYTLMIESRCGMGTITASYSEGTEFSAGPGSFLQRGKYALFLQANTVAVTQIRLIASFHVLFTTLH